MDRKACNIYSPALYIKSLQISTLERGKLLDWCDANELLARKIEIVEF